MSAKGLYSPDILAAAMELARYPWNEDLPFKALARSRSCGSSIELGLSTGENGAITAIGIRPHACAVGQAAAALFAANASGLTRSAITQARAALAGWLSGAGPMPEWPRIDLLLPALAYPARHAAILLAWDAALDALPYPGRA
jgi:NifU-like protein involved in Fe-S cluster formation